MIAKTIGVGALVTLIVTLASTLISCSNILFYDHTHKSDNLTSDDIAKQIELLKKSDPVFDSTFAHLILDNRLVSVMGAGEYFPGTNVDVSLLRQTGSKAIWGSTDLSPNDTLVAWAAEYSYRYNSNLLSLRNQKTYLRELDARERMYIDQFKK